MKCRACFLCFLGIVLGALFVAPLSEGQSQQSTSPPLSEKAKKGKDLFTDNCFICHDRDSDRVKMLGPSLDGLFKRKTLIVGKPVTEENVKEVIKMGPTPGMPGFRYKLSDTEIDALVEFLKTK